MNFARDFLRIVYDILLKKDLAVLDQDVFTEHFLRSKKDHFRALLGGFRDIVYQA